MVDMQDFIDVDAEIQRSEKEIDRLRQAITGKEKQLSNSNFVETGSSRDSRPRTRKSAATARSIAIGRTGPLRFAKPSVVAAWALLDAGCRQARAQSDTRGRGYRGAERGVRGSNSAAAPPPPRPEKCSTGRAPTDRHATFRPHPSDLCSLSFAANNDMDSAGESASSATSSPRWHHQRSPHSMDELRFLGESRELLAASLVYFRCGPSCQRFRHRTPPDLGNDYP